MDKHQVHEGALVGGADDGDEVGDAEQRDDDQQGLGGSPVLRRI